MRVILGDNRKYFCSKPLMVRPTISEAAISRSEYSLLPEVPLGSSRTTAK